MFRLRPYKEKYELAVKVAGSMASEIIRLKVETNKLKAETNKLKAELKDREGEIVTLKDALSNSSEKLQRIKDVYGAK